MARASGGAEQRRAVLAEGALGRDGLAGEGEQVEALGRELDAIRRDIEDSRGARDARYIRRTIAAQRGLLGEAEAGACGSGDAPRAARPAVRCQAAQAA